MRVLALCLCCYLLLLPLNPLEASWESRPYALVNPAPGTSHLRVADEGLELLRSIDSPVAPVVVIGPYRSGKSFLLNQLLGVPCDAGFGVGHTRETETKGIWVWGQPQNISDSGQQRTVLYVDTEGFESTSRSNSYDDRVFAVATVISSLLIYNLPETIRGSDVNKLSFVVELAAGFYDQTKKGAIPVEPGSMLWVIQRDFLLGKSVQQLVADALTPVPNPHNDKAIAETNNIRSSLGSIAKNSTGFSLPQPHLDRTKLCDLNDAELDQRYVKQRDALRTLVQQQAQQKLVGGQPLTGKSLASLLQSLVSALNAKEIPTGAGLIESFNREIVMKALQRYQQQLDGAVILPADEHVLTQADKAAREAALAHFQEQLLGRRQADDLQQQLDAAIAKEYKAKVTANIAESNVLCHELEMVCVKLLDAAASGVQLPSMYQFEGRYKSCEANFKNKCVGPARSSSEERLQLSWKQARAQFVKDYNDRLFTGLLVCSVAAIVVFRFVVKVAVLEAVGWVSVVFLELYPHLFLGSGSMYETKWWKLTTRVWEFIMLLIFGAGGLLVWLVLVGGVLLLWRSRRKQASKKAILTSVQGDIRDLDV